MFKLIQKQMQNPTEQETSQQQPGVAPPPTPLDSQTVAAPQAQPAASQKQCSNSNQLPRSKAPEDSEDQRAPSVAISKGISSQQNRSETMTFPNTFKLDIEYSSYEEIMRILRREEVQAGLPIKFMKEILTNRNEPNHNVVIRCRICNSYVDWKFVNGKYVVSVLRNRHTHGKDVKGNGGKNEADKKEMPKPKFPQFPAFHTPVPSNPLAQKAQNGAPSGLKSFIQTLRVSIPCPATGKTLAQNNNTSTPASKCDSYGLGMGLAATPSNQQAKPIKTKFKELEEFLVAEGYELIVDQGRQPPGAYPEIIMAVSPTMKRNFERFGDLVSFHIVQLPISETSETGHNYRLGVFIVYSYNRKQLVAGVTILCRQTAAATRTVFEFFLKLHNKKQPESISTSCEKEICLAMNQLQDEGIFNGIHIVDSQQALQCLEQGLKIRNRLTREVIDLCVRVVAERSKATADKIIRDIRELIEVQDENIQKTVYDFLNQKEKIFVSSLPAAFLGIFDTNDLNRQFDEILTKKVENVTTIENICRALVIVDGELLDHSFDKIVIYADPIEDVFYDPRIKVVRESLDAGVFKIFIQNYTEGFCYNQIKPLEEGQSPETIKVFSMRNAQTFELNGWTCTCDETKRTGLPCSHLLAVAIETPELTYLSLIKDRWREAEASAPSESEPIDVLSQNLDQLPTPQTIEIEKPIEEKPAEHKTDEEKVPALPVNVEIVENQQKTTEITNALVCVDNQIQNALNDEHSAKLHGIHKVSGLCEGLTNQPEACGENANSKMDIEEGEIRAPLAASLVKLD